jgi:hypothetical protein
MPDPGSSRRHYIGSREQAAREQANILDIQRYPENNRIGLRGPVFTS